MMINKIARGVIRPWLLGRLILRAVRATLRNCYTLSVEFGQFKTARRGQSTDRYGNPIPWFTYPAVEYIKQLDFSDKTIFEYGSGNGTIFWAARCKKLVAVEDNQHWYNRLKGELPDNVDYILSNEKEKYINSIDNYPQKFDVIIIDGYHRYECAVRALRNLKDDGLIILDNSDWMDKTPEALRESNLIQVDMSGFGPALGWTWTTSFFFTRGVDLKPAHDRQPIPGVGSVPPLVRVE